MPLYCTQADMEARYDKLTLVQLTDRPATDQTPPATTITASTLNAVIADACATIDSYVGRVEALPLASVPPSLVQHACSLVLFGLYRDAVPEHVKARRDEAIGFLRDVSAGRVRLFPAQNAEQGTGDGLVETSMPPRLFTRDTMKGGA